MHVGKILIALIGVFLFLFTSVRGEIKDFSIKAFHLDFRAQVIAGTVITWARKSKSFSFRFPSPSYDGSGDKRTGFGSV